MSDELKDVGILTITDEKSKNASVGAPRPVTPSSLCYRKCQWYCKTARLGNCCSPQFWDVDKRCGAGDDSPRRWVWQEVERIRSCSAHLPICYSTVAFLGGSEKWSEGEKCDPPPCGCNCCNPCCRAFDRSCTNRSGWRSPWSIARNQLEPCDKFAM